METQNNGFNLKLGCLLLTVAIVGSTLWLVRPYSNTLFQLMRYERTTGDAGFSIAKELNQCPGAPFVMPTSGWIGILYGDSILGTRSHSGLDIFGGEGNGVTSIYASYDGYVTRLPNWTSAVIIRHPEDPLDHEKTIWTYYAHMADVKGNSYIVEQIPAGTYDLPVKQGALLGYQGDYNSTSLRRISTHLHFSIVKDDGNGQFLNETDLSNTIDPSPYLGMRLNSVCGDRPPTCRVDFECP